MGLLRNREPDLLDHPPVERMVYLRADREAVLAHLDDYSRFCSPKHAAERRVAVAANGGWVAIRLPDTVHAWQLHNLAFWMLDCPTAGRQVVAESGPAPTHPGYRLVHDPEVPDALCGWDALGAGWTVDVPGNDVVRGEDVPVGPIVCPSGFSDWCEVTVRLADPGAAMNPANVATFAARRHLIARYEYAY